MFDTNSFNTDLFPSVEFRDSAMGPAEFAYHEQHNGVLIESAWISDVVKKKAEAEASSLARVTGEIVKQFGTHEFTILTDLVQSDIDRSTLNNDESINLDPSDYRNLVGGDHIKYIENITDSTQYESVSDRQGTTVSDLSDHRQRVAEQYNHSAPQAA